MYKATANRKVEELNSVKYRMQEIFTVKNVVLYIVSLLLSVISINGVVYPFGYAMISAGVSEGIPIVGVFIATVIGTIITGKVSSFFHFIVVNIFYIVFVLIFRSNYAVEERSESFKTGGKMFAAYTFVGFFKTLFYGFSMQKFIMEILVASIIYVFYKILVNGIYFIENINIKEVFSFEEMLAGFLIFTLAFASIYKVFNIPIIFLAVISFILLSIIGAKNGIIEGGISGVAYGFFLWLFFETNPYLTILFLIAGIIGGILGKLNNIGIVITIVLINIILLCIKNVDTSIIYYFRVITLSELILLFIHKNLKIKGFGVLDEDILGEGIVRGLNPPKEFKFENELKEINENLKNIIDTNPYTLDNSKIIEEYKKDFLENIRKNINDNIFLETLLCEKNGIADDISKVIIEKNEIYFDDFIYIMKKHNNFIVLKNEKVVKDVEEIVNISNNTFAEFDYKKRLEELKEKTLEESEKILGKDDTLSHKIEKVLDDESEEKSEEDKMYSSFKNQIMELLKNKNIRVEDVSLKFVENGKNIIELKFDYFDTRIKNKDVTNNIADNLTKMLGNRIIFQREKNDDIERTYSQIYSSEDKFVLQVGSSRISKDESEVSSDCSLQIRLSDGKYLLAIADRGESGSEIREIAKKDLKVLKQILVNGFNDAITSEKILEILEKKNGISNLHLDIMILDLFVGKVDLFKYGTIKSLMKNGKEIKEIKIPKSKNVMYQYSQKIESGDTYILASDGVVNSVINDNWINKFLINIATTNIQRIADYIVEEAIENSFGVVQDDMTVIVCRVVKKKK